jgi:hypothetical protein
LQVEGTIQMAGEAADTGFAWAGVALTAVGRRCRIKPAGDGAKGWIN